MKTLVIALFVFAGNALACSCAEWGTAREVLADTNAAFLGTVQSASNIPEDSQEANRSTTFLVKKAFKPRFLRRTFSVRSTLGDGANCGTDFRRGETYLILAYRDPATGLHYTSACDLRYMDNSREMRALIKEFTRASSSR